jgi:protein-S-isoprenylcysteine O-methyltransferase Ste14
MRTEDDQKVPKRPAPPPSSPPASTAYPSTSSRSNRHVARSINRPRLDLFARPILWLLAEFRVLFCYRPANAGHIKMWDSIPNWIRYGAVVIAIIFIVIAIWYMSQ